jgi:hypothetical protein
VSLREWSANKLNAVPRGWDMMCLTIGQLQLHRLQHRPAVKGQTKCFFVFFFGGGEQRLNEKLREFPINAIASGLTIDGISIALTISSIA